MTQCDIIINFMDKDQRWFFFHGFGFDSSIWQHLIPNLCNEYQLCFVDLPGFGRTVWQPGISLRKNY